MSEFIQFDALLQVVVAGAIVGAGLPALFALGVRLLATPATGVTVAVEGAPSGTDAAGPTTARPTGVRLAGAVVCFGAVLAACQVDGRHWSTVEGRAVVLADPESVRLAERLYAERYKTPRDNPERVALRISVTRVLGNVR